MKIQVTIVFLVFLFLSCNHEHQESNNMQKDIDNKFKYKESLSSLNDCNPKEEGCAYAKVKFPFFTDGDQKEQLNKYIETLIRTSDITASELGTSASVDESLQNFVKSYVKASQSNPATSQRPWSYSRIFNIMNINKEFMSISYSTHTFMGGAHPNSFSKFKNVRLADQKEITLDEVFQGDYKTQLNKIIDAQFRQENGIAPGEDLMDKGGLFENKIEMNDNFIFLPNKLLFLYNPYEIAPYARGPIRVGLDRKTIKEMAPDILKKGNPVF